MLADERSPVYIPPAWDVVASLWADETKAIHAFRTGAGVGWGEHDERLSCGVAAFYRNGYRANLVPEWLPALEGVAAKLETGARVADIGCGHGYSTLFMAEAFPNSRFLGFDTHPASIEVARELAREAGLEHRVEFVLADAREPLPGPFDLACFFDCLHDLGHPVEAARRARDALAVDGTLMLVEPYASDKVEENLNPVGRLYYAASSTICCAHAISENGTHVLGAQAGEARLARICREAGFSSSRPEACNKAGAGHRTRSRHAGVLRHARGTGSPVAHVAASGCLDRARHRLGMGQADPGLRRRYGSDGDDGRARGGTRLARPATHYCCRAERH